MIGSPGKQRTLVPADSLESALRAFDECGLERLLVVDPQDSGQVLGVVDQAQVLKTFNAALVQAVTEENG
jgi:CIC family chloride channel protein